MRLIVEEGYHRGVEYQLASGLAVLGRGEECTLQLFDESVSRQHARLLVGEQAARVEDLNSRNRTLLNGVPVSRAELLDGDRLSLGSVRFVVVLPPFRARAVSEEGATAAVDAETQALRAPGLSMLPGLRDDELIAESPAMRAFASQLERWASGEQCLLLRGELGSGRRTWARGLHRLSPRRRGPWIVFECARVPVDQQLEELFGRVGASPGANRSGLLTQAHEGSLLLADVEHLGRAAQEGLLAFLRSTRRLRLLASCGPQEVELASSLLPELLTMLRAAELRLPALRQRGFDAILLARAFLERCGGPPRHLSQAAVERLAGYAWPGNVGELRRVVELAALRATGAQVMPEALALG